MQREWHLRRSAVRGGLLSRVASPTQIINLVVVALSLLPISVLFAGLLVLSATLLLPSTPAKPDFEAGLDLSSFKGHTSSKASPSLSELLATVADALDAENVTFWLLPGLGLHPASANAPTNTIGALSPWQEGIDIGTADGSTMAVIRAQTRLQTEHSILVTESYFGLRLFHAAGALDDRYDFRTPFIDLVQFRSRDDLLVAPCCDCGPIVVGACTKKLCDCLACVLSEDDVYPRRNIIIEGVRRRLPCVRRVESLMLPGDLPGVHPLATQGVIPRPPGVG